MTGADDPLDIKALTCVMGDVLAERVNQVMTHGYDPGHDDTHDRREWAWLLEARVHALAVPWISAVVDERRQLVEIAAIAMAALQAFDRHAAGRALTAPEHRLPFFAAGGRIVYLAKRNSDEVQAMVAAHGFACNGTINTPDCAIRTSTDTVHWHLPERPEPIPDTEPF